MSCYSQLNHATATGETCGLCATYYHCKCREKKIIWFFFQYWSVPSRELWTGQQCVRDDSSASASGAGDRRKRALWGRQANRSMVQVLSWSGLVKILCGRLPGMCKPSVHNKLLLMSWIGSTLLNPIIQPRAGGGGGGIKAMTVKPEE